MLIGLENLNNLQEIELHCDQFLFLEIGRPFFTSTLPKVSIKPDAPRDKRNQTFHCETAGVKGLFVYIEDLRVRLVRQIEHSPIF